MVAGLVNNEDRQIMDSSTGLNKPQAKKF